MLNLNLSQTYSIEPKLKRGDLQGLDREGISTHVGTSRLFYAKFDHTTGKFITGLDVNAKSVLSLPKEEREKRQSEIKALKEELEAYFGQPGLLDAAPRRSTDTGDLIECFWDTFGISITTGNNKVAYINIDGKKVFELDVANNPIHKLAMIMLDANDYMPKSKFDAANPKYKDEKFLFTTNDEVEKESAKTVRKEIRRGSELGKLFGDNINYDRAWEIAYYMGLKPKKNVGENKLQEDLFMATKVDEFLDLFLEACELSNEDLTTSNLFKQGVALDLIKYNGEIKLYTFGATNLKNTEKDSIDYLKNSEMSTALAQLREMVNKRKKVSKNLA